MSWDLAEEKLLCFMVLSDTVAPALSENCGSAYWRGFILENRQTGQVYAKFRFKYASDDRSWFEIRPKSEASREEKLEELRIGLECILKIGMVAFGVDPEISEKAIDCYYPPDDEGDPIRTITWLEEQDLIEVKVELDEVQQSEEKN